jgi:hypothetical protein
MVHYHYLIHCRNNIYDVPAPEWPVDSHSNYPVLVPLSLVVPAKKGGGGGGGDKSKLLNLKK